MQAARTPNMDRASREGLTGVVNNVPPDMPPGSDVAIMSVLGYDPRTCYTGRAPLEATDLGIELSKGELAFRCNLVTTSEGSMADFCAGHISTEEAEVLIEALNEEFDDEPVEFFVGTGYRHIMVYRGEDSLDPTTTPPHDIMDEPIDAHLPRGPGADYLRDLMERSTEVLADHEVNDVRVDLEQNPGNMIWLWGQGHRSPMQPFKERFSLRGAGISAVNLVRGLARLIGWDVIDVPGATAYLDTDYAAKGRHACDALNDYDIVLVHVEAPDEAGHEGNVKGKIQAIERVDRDIVGPVMSLSDSLSEFRVLVLPDHYTPLHKRTHARGAVPFAMWGQGVATESGLEFTEENARSTGCSVEEGHELMETFVNGQDL
jgi:2,3-bisphosphoglycerate-independent phosphoglycerate mutase